LDRWVTPEEFAMWKEKSLEWGFGVVESGPLVRSSYHADEQSAKYAN
jgi:lipoic acid synthetase